MTVQAAEPAKLLFLLKCSTAQFRRKKGFRFFCRYLDTACPPPNTVHFIFTDFFLKWLPFSRQGLATMFIANSQK